MKVVEQLRELLAKATPGPWKIVFRPGRSMPGWPSETGRYVMVGPRDDWQTVGGNDDELAIIAMRDAITDLLEVAASAERIDLLHTEDFCRRRVPCPKCQLITALAKLK